MNNSGRRREQIRKSILTVIFSLASLIWVSPVLIVLYNSFKNNDAIKTSLFSLPDKGDFAGISNYIRGIAHGNYPFYYAMLFSLVITVLSVTLILLCTSMSAWYINRVDSIFLQNIVLSLHLFNGCTIPDGYVYSFKDG